MELNWESARKWEKEANKDKDDTLEPNWSWDCGFKLDFDGSLISISSRFYPEGQYSNPSWGGNVTIYLLNEEIEKKVFNCNNLEELRLKVEDCIKEYVEGIKRKIKE